MKKVIIVFIAAVALAACSNKYRVDDVQKAEQNVSLNSHFYVMQTTDGRFEGQVYSGSGQMAVGAVAGVLRTNGAQVTMASSTESFNEALALAKANSADYLFQTSIQHWEDRATEWNAMVDRITMRYTVYNVNDGSKTSSMVVSASSKLMTFGGDHPQDLVPETVQRFLNQAF